MLNMADPNARRSRIHSFVGRFGYGVADQLVSSLSNVVVMIAIARQVSATDFGAFSLGYFAYIACLGFARAVNGDVLIVHSGEELDERQRDLAVGSAAALGGILAAPIVIAAALTADPSRGALLVFAVFLPPLLVQDFCRQIALVSGKAAVALVSDSQWLVLTLTGVAIWSTFGSPELNGLIAVWGVAGVVSLLPFAMARVARIEFNVRSWLGHRVETRRRLGTDFFLSLGIRQLALLGLGAFVGLQALGAFRAGQTIFGLVAVVQYALIQVGTVSAARSWATQRTFHVRPCVAISTVLTFASLALAGALALLPSSVGQALLGDTWSGAQALFLPIGVWTASLMLTTGAEIGFRGTGFLTALIKLRLTVGIVYIGALWFGSSLLGLANALYLGAALFTLLSFAWWFSLFSEIRHAETARADG